MLKMISLIIFISFGLNLLAKENLFLKLLNEKQSYGNGFLEGKIKNESDIHRVVLKSETTIPIKIPPDKKQIICRLNRWEKISENEKQITTRDLRLILIKILLNLNPNDINDRNFIINLIKDKYHSTNNKKEANK